MMVRMAATTVAFIRGPKRRWQCNKANRHEHVVNDRDNRADAK